MRTTSRLRHLLSLLALLSTLSACQTTPPLSSSLPPPAAATTSLAPTPTRGIAPVDTVVPQVTTSPTQPRPEPSPTSVPVPSTTTFPVPTHITPARSDLQDVLAETAKRYPGRLGFYVKHLGTGETASLNADQPLVSASLYKLFVLYTAFAEIERGELTLDETLSLSQAAFSRDPYAEWPVGTRLQVSCALQGMISVSSNSAANLLLERVGGWDRVRREIGQLGLKQSGPRADGYAYTTASEVGILLEAIATGRAVSHTASQRMIALLKSQQYNDRLPLPLPLNVEVAHKTGELDGVRNDAGIAFAPSGPYVFVALATGAPADSAATSAIVELSHGVYEHFEPGGTRSYMGLPPRLAREILRVPDSSAPILPIDDDWGETTAFSSQAVELVRGRQNVRLREMVGQDLIALQKGARSAGTQVWVVSGYPSMRDPDAPFFIDSSALGCQVSLPAGKRPLGQSLADFAVSAAPSAFSQEWLGTVVRIAESRDGAPTTSMESAAAGEWVRAHAWEYGFVLVPLEKAGVSASVYEPRMLRWVGHDLAARLHSQGYETQERDLVTLELRRAMAELAAR